jgi:hypothetical protein
MWSPRGLTIKLATKTSYRRCRFIQRNLWLLAIRFGSIIVGLNLPHVENGRLLAIISECPLTGFGRLRRSSSATFQTKSIARPGNAAAAPLHRTFPIVIGETKGCFTAHSENIVRWLTCSSTITDAFMVIQDQLRKPKLRCRPSEAAANADLRALPVESAPLPSCTHFERPHWSNRSSLPWAGGVLEAIIF